MRNVGCYVRYDFNLQNIQNNGSNPDGTLEPDTTATKCSELCHVNDDCSAWSYQISNQKCILFKEANDTLLHPEKTVDGSINQSPHHLGWISGLKACKHFDPEDDENDDEEPQGERKIKHQEEKSEKKVVQKKLFQKGWQKMFDTAN